MRPLDTGARDLALRRTRRLRWLVVLIAAAVSLAGTTIARATFRGHPKPAAGSSHAVAKATIATPLPRRPMPNLVPLPSGSGGAGDQSSPGVAPAPSQAPAPVVSGGS